MRSLLLLSAFLLANAFAFAEGSDELWADPNPQPGYAGTALYLCSDFEFQCGGNGIRTQFAIVGCNSEDQLNFIVDTATEKVYLGFDGDPQNGWFDNTKIVYLIRNSSGTVVKTSTDLPTSGTGFINSIDEARIGPQQIAGAGGYDAIEWVPPGPDTYSLEFDRIDIDSGEREPGSFQIDLFDVTVADSNTNIVEKGRLYSKGWQFIEPNFGSGDLNYSTFYIFSKDSIITSVEYDGMEGRAWLMFCNQTGCANTGNFEEDRKSLYGQQAYVPQYNIFLNPPDSTLFPPATTTGSIVNVDDPVKDCDTGEVTFNVEVDRAGNVEIFLDFPDPYVDLPLTAAVEKGDNIIIWSGNDGGGTPVPNGTNIDFTITYLNGLTHLPLYDIERNQNGFTIGLYAPIPPSGDPTPFVFWDDSYIPNGTTEFDGCQSPPGCHPWTDVDYGNENTINTWWYSASVSTIPVTVEQERTASTLVFEQPPQTGCGGSFGNYFSVTPDPNTEAYHFSTTGTGWTINHADPADNFVTIDFAPNATPGDLEVYGTNSNCTLPGPTTSLFLNIGPVPEVSFSLSPNDTVCVNQDVDFFGSDASGTNIIDWSWDFGDGNTGVGQNTTHVYTSVIETDVELIAENDYGCFDTIYNTIRVEDPSIDMNIDNDTACVGQEVFFYGLGDADFANWTWDFGDGSPTASGQNVSHIFTVADTFDIELNVCTKTIFRTVIVNPQALADAGSNEQLCESAPFDLSTSTTPPSANDYVSLEWFGGTGTFSDPNIIWPIYTPGTGEVGDVQLGLVAFAYDACSNDTSYMTLSLDSLPIPDYTWLPVDSICVDEELQFFGTNSTLSPITSWSWDFDDGSTANIQEPFHSFSSAGLHNVKLIITNQEGCTDSITQQVQVHELPVASITANPGTTVCAEIPMTFNGSSTTTITDWEWNFGDGNNATGQNVNHTFSAAGTYIVTLSVLNNNSCEDTHTETITVNPLPEADFSMFPDDTNCVGETVNFDATEISGGITSWQWQFGDGATDVGQSATHTYAAPGNYDVLLIFENGNGCLDTVIHQRRIELIDIDFNATPTSCVNHDVDFTGIDNNANATFRDWEWDFGDGSPTGIGKDITHTYTTDGTYTVTLSFCTESISHDITINPQAIADAGSPEATCEDLAFDLSTSAIIPTADDFDFIEWYGGAGSFDDPSLVAPVYTPAPGELGLIDLYMVAHGIAPCENDTSIMTLNVIEGAYADAGSDENSCFGEAFDFQTATNQPFALNYDNLEWSGGSGYFIDPNVERPIYVPGPAEVGPVELTMTAWGNIVNCDSVDEMTLYIRPEYLTPQDFTLCYGDSLFAQGDWRYSSGTFYDTLQSVWTCDSVIQTNLTVYPKIDKDFTISTGDSICLGEISTFTQTGSANLTGWFWNFGDGFTSTDANPSHEYTSPGTFDVWFYYSDNLGCNDSAMHRVTIFELPDVEIQATHTVCCENTQVDFTGLSGDNIISWQWTFDGGTTAFGPNVSFLYTTPGDYMVTLDVVAASGCTNTDIYWIHVVPPPTAEFTHEIYVCDTVDFTDQSVSPPGYNLVEWSWDFGDGGTSNLQDPQHVFPGGGNYDVMLTVTADSAGFFCYDSVTHVVQIPNPPTVYFTWAPEPACLGEETFFFGTSGNFIDSWYWDFGDGFHGTVQEPIHTYTSPGLYDVTLTVTDTNGCSNSVMHTVSVSDIPTASFTMSAGSGCIDEMIDFTDQSSADVVSWSWDFGDGGMSSQQNPSHAYSSGGVYLVVLTVTDAAGCTATDAQTVVIIDPPVADFTTLPNGCNTLDFTDQTTAPPGHAIVEWLWEFGDGQTSILQNPSHTYSAAGFYDVILTATSDSAGFRCSDTVLQTVNVPIPPTITFNWSPEPTFFGDPTSFFGNGSGIVDWQWDFGDGYSSNQQNPQHTYLAPGTYTVTLIGTNVHNCSDTAVNDVMVVGTPDVDFTIENNPSCIDEPVIFTGQSSYDIAVWLWDFGDGTDGFGQNVTHTYDTEGDYTVTLTVTDIWGVSNSTSQVLQIRSRPMAFFDFTEPTCQNDSVYFTDLSVTEYGYIDRYVWNYGDGSVNDTIFHPNNPNVYHSFPNSGTFNVTLEVQSSLGCTDSFDADVQLLNSPIANFNVIGESCQNQVVQFEDASFANGSGNIIEWDWNFGDPLSGVDNTSSLQNPEHIFSTSDTFDVRLIIRNFNNCTDTIVKQVFVNPEPQADFLWDISCQGQETQFLIDTAATDNNITDWFWDFGDGITSDLMEPLHVYEVSGTYTVTLYVENTEICPGQISHDITVHPEPQANFDFSVPTCQDTEVQFIDLSSTGSGYVTQWVYDYGDGTVDTINYPDSPDPIHVYDTTGTFQVTQWILTTDSCEAEISKEIFVTPAPIADFEHEGSCFDAPVQFTDLSVGVGGEPVSEWSWDFGDPLSGQNNFSQLQNPTHIFSQPGTYDVTLIAFNSSTCSDTVVQQVIAQPLPDVDFTSEDLSCFESIAYFYADSTLIDMGATQIFEWTFGDGSPPVYQQNAMHQYQATGEYQVTLTITDTAGCVNSIMKLHTVVEAPTASFEYANACQSDTTSFTDFSYTSGGDQIIEWLWDFGDPSSPNNTSTQQNPVHIYSATGNYQVKLVVTSQGGCTDSLTRSISIYERPLAGFSYVADPCQVGVVYFNDSSFANSTSIEDYFWTFEPGFYSDVKNPDYDFQMGDTCLDVSLVVTDGRGCRDTVVREVCIPAEIEIGFDFTATCFGEATDFTSFILSPTGDSLINFEWDFGEPASGQANTSYLANPSHTYLDDGTYTVSLRAMDLQGCWVEFSDQVTVHALPEAAFEWESFVCDSAVHFEDFSIGNNSPMKSWTWDFGDGTAPLIVNAPDDPDVSHVYASPGYYQVMLIAENNNGCVDTATQEVFREFCIRASFGVLDTLICQGFDIAFTDTSIYPDVISLWEWNFGDMSDTTYASYSPVIEHSFAGAGTYTVSLVVHSQQGGVPITDTMFRDVQVLPTPVPGFSVEPVCLGITSEFFDNSSGGGSELSAWMWDFGVPGSDEDTSTFFSPSFEYPLADSFQVWMKVWAKNGCYDSIMDTTVVNPLPLADFDWDLACAATTTNFFDLSDTSGGYSGQWHWRWNFGDTLAQFDTSSLQNPSYVYDSVGMYNPQLEIINENGCRDTVSHSLEIFPSPLAGFSYRENYDNVQGQLQMVNESKGATRYEWFFDYSIDPGVDSEQEHPLYQYTEDGLYEILLVSYNQFECPDSSFYEYMLEFKGLFVPNAFSPNNPASDVQVFRPKGMNLEQYHIAVYDRWGKLLWESDELDSDGSPAESWDGTSDGKEMPMGTYFWKIRASFVDGSVWEGESIGNNDGGAGETFGTVTLIR